VVGIFIEIPLNGINPSSAICEVWQK